MLGIEYVSSFLLPRQLTGITVVHDERSSYAVILILHIKTMGDSNVLPQVFSFALLKGKARTGIKTNIWIKLFVVIVEHFDIRLPQKPIPVSLAAGKAPLSQLAFDFIFDCARNTDGFIACEVEQILVILRTHEIKKYACISY